MSRTSAARRVLANAILAGTALALLGGLGMVVAWWLWPPRLEPGPGFEAEAVDLASYNWFDAGIADVDGDGLLDIYTANHNARQSLLRNLGSGQFQDRLVPLGLQQDREFPGLEDGPTPPPRDRPGTYIYWLKGRLVLEVLPGAGLGAPVGGEILLATDVAVRGSRGIQLEVSGGPGTAARAPGGSIVRFTTVAGAELQLEVPQVAVPVRFRLDPAVSLHQVFVGSQGVNPAGHEFQLHLRDRHGMAWADINGDDQADVLMVRGGLRGQMARFPLTFRDELFLSDGAGAYADAAPERGLVKGACPARQVAWVDGEGDGRLDAYITCGTQAGVAPNQYHRQSAEGRFTDVAGSLGLDLAEPGTFAWLDLDADGDPDLLWTGPDGLALYRNSGGNFQREAVEAPFGPRPKKLALGDFDGDGDTDVFAAALSGSRLLVNEGGQLRVRPSGDLGLPGWARTATWVDYDNDGRPDLYAWPGGLYRQDEDGQFTATGLLRVSSPFWFLVEPRVLWFDADADGRLDALVLQRFAYGFLQELDAAHFEPGAVLLANRQAAAGHWLQVDLAGRGGNRPAIGARVAVVAGGRIQLQQPGQFDGSHYSQGHYRLYFGLGSEARPEALTVYWPDGHVQRIENPPGDRRLILGR